MQTKGLNNYYDTTVFQGLNILKEHYFSCHNIKI